MNISKQQRADFTRKDILRDLIPFNALSEERYRDLSDHLQIQDIEAGSYLFREGDSDNRAIYLLDGVVNLIDASGGVTDVVSAGTAPARYPLADQQPRSVSARTTTRSVIGTIDRTLLDIMLTLDQSADTGVIRTTTGNGKEWITRMLQSTAFSRLTPSNIQQLLQSLESLPVQAGEVVIREGDIGDYFYIVREGKCAVTRMASGRGWEIPLAKLDEGDCFGEEALVSDARRNATVTMLTDGNLMRLSKKSFVELLKKPLLQYIDYDLAMVSVEAGDVWLDVRLQDEHSNNALENSINAPLAQIRDKAGLLDPARKYILYCDTGRRSAAAAFIMSQQGFDVCVLEGGLNNGVPADVPAPGRGSHAGAATPDTPARVVPGPAPAPAGPGLQAVPAPATEHTPAAGDEADPEGLQQQEPSLEEVLSGLQAEVDEYMEQVRKIEDACKKALQSRNTITARINRLSRQAAASKQS